MIFSSFLATFLKRAGRRRLTGGGNLARTSKVAGALLFFHVVSGLALTGFGGDTSAWARMPPATWTMTPVLKILNASGEEIPSPANIRAAETDEPVKVGLYVDMEETSGVLDPWFARHLDGYLGVDAMGGAIHFEIASLTESDSDSVLPDVSSVLTEVVDQLAPKPGTYTSNFHKMISDRTDRSWQFAWVSEPGYLAFVRGAWCHPGEQQPSEKRRCEISFGNLLVPVANVPPGSELSLTVGGFEKSDERVIVIPFDHVSDPRTVTSVIAEGNTVVLNVLP